MPEEDRATPEARQAWQFVRPVLVILAALHYLTRAICYVAGLFFAALLACMAVLLALRILLAPAFGADLYTACAALLPEHRQTFLEAAKTGAASSVGSSPDAATCRLLVPSALGLVASRLPPERESALDPATVKDVLQRSWPSPK